MIQFYLISVGPRVLWQIEEAPKAEILRARARFLCLRIDRPAVNVKGNKNCPKHSLYLRHLTLLTAVQVNSPWPGRAGQFSSVSAGTPAWASPTS